MTTSRTAGAETALDDLRRRIDDADATLLRALRDRLEAIRQIARTKADHGAPIVDAEREDGVWTRWRELADDTGLDPHAAGRLLREILGWSRRTQESEWRPTSPATVRVAIQGDTHSHSEAAARELMALRGATAQPVSKHTFDEVLAALRGGEVDYALVPTENSIIGGIEPVQSLLLEAQAHIVDEELWSVRHALAARPGATLQSIRRVASHPVALRQCRRSVVEELGLQEVEVWDTAGAARDLAASADQDLAVLCAPEAAAAYGLQVLRDDVSDQPDNRTRFLLLARDPEPVPPGVPTRTTLRLVADHRPGSLARCLGAFAEHGVNLTRIVSQVLPRRAGQYGFLIDIDGDVDMPEVAAALVEVRASANQVVSLGSYPDRRPETLRRTPRTAPAPADREPAPAAATPAAPRPTKSLPLVTSSPQTAGPARSIAGVPIGGEHFVLIAGPCAVESEEQIERAADMVAATGAALMRGGAFKPRTSTYSFQGLGLPGVQLLKKAGRRVELPVVTEILQARDVEDVAEIADVLQVGARNMQNFELLRALGRIDRPVLLKRGMSATLDELLHAAEYILAGGNQQVILCERGIRTFETATRATLDVAAVPVLKQRTHLPVIVDPSHAAGVRSLVVPLALAAAAAGADGLIVECHPDPAAALCDKDQALTAADMQQLVDGLRPILAGQGRRMG